MFEVAAMLSISAGKQVSIAMTVEKLKAEIQSDSVYKYLRQTVAGSIQVAKYVGELAVYKLTLSPGGLIMYKGSRFLVPKVLSAGLLKAFHFGYPGVLAMVMRACMRDILSANLKGAVVQVRAQCLLCNQNSPSQAK
jgi:hypothetical protein